MDAIYGVLGEGKHSFLASEPIIDRAVKAIGGCRGR